MSFYEKGNPEPVNTGAEGTDENEKNEKGSSGWMEFLITLMIAAGVGICINMFILVNAVIPTGSMEETIMPGDRIFGSRLTYVFSDPERYDIVIFKFPDDESDLFIKRVIGLPNETVVCKGGKAYIIPASVDTSKMDDAELMKDPLAFEGAFVTNDSFCPEIPEAYGEGVYRVPEDHYFMMGDNRNNSRDSRFWDNKYVERKKILGRAFLKYWPLNEMKTFKYGDL